MMSRSNSRKVVAAVLSVALALSAAGCSSKSNKNSNNTLEGFIEDKGYKELSNKNGDAYEKLLNGSKGQYITIDDEKDIEDMMDISAEVESVIMASRFVEYDADFEDEYSKGSRGVNSGFIVVQMEFAADDDAAEMMEMLIEDNDDMFDYMADDADDYYSDFSDDAIIMALQRGDAFSYYEYLLDGNKIIVFNSVFVCQGAPYEDFIELHDYLGFDSPVDLIDEQPVSEDDFDMDEYVKNPDNIFDRAKMAVQVVEGH